MGQVAVYKRGTIDFYNQGLGILSDVLSSELTQVVNGSGTVSQQLVLEYPTDGYLANQLVEGNLLRVSISKDKDDYGIFEISDSLKDDGGTLTIYGDAYYNRILRMSFDNGGMFSTYPNVQVALDEARLAITGFPVGFALTSNLGKSVDLSGKNYENFGDFLEALASASGGNVKYTVNGIQIYSALGKDIKNITLRDDMNTSSVKVKTDYSGIINKVIPILPGKDNEGNSTQDMVVGNVVTSKYGHQFLDYWAGKVINFDTQELANSYFDRTHADRPVQTVEVEPLDMDEDFSAINIFDRITLYSTKLNYQDKLRVSERVFDTLSEEVKSFKLGSSTANVFNQINEQQDQLFNNVKNITNALISANGKGLNYYGQAEPEAPKEGDLWFFDDGENSGIKQFINGEWVLLVELATAKKITDSVTQTLIDAQNYSDKLVADNAEQVNRVLSDVQDKQVALKNEQIEFDKKAQGYASKALEDAKADALKTSQDLVSSIQSEVNNRVKAVTDLDTKAQGYVAKAKSDLIENLAKETRDRTNALTALDKKATDAINQAKEDAQSAVNALSTGDRNYVLDTGNPKRLPGYGHDNFDYFNQAKLYKPLQSWGTKAEAPYVISFDWTLDTPLTADMNASVFFNQSPWQEQRYVIPANQKTGHTTFLIKLNAGLLTQQTEITSLTFRVNNQLAQGNALTISNLYMKSGNVPTDWTPAPEDVVLDYTTKDNEIKRSLTKYQEDNDGRVSTAQSAVHQALEELSTKVSKTTFDQKTGDLESRYSTIKQTADNISADISNIRSTDHGQDSRMANIEADANGIRSTVSSIQKTQGQQAGSISTLQQTADRVEATVSTLGQINQLFNTEFSPDFQGWYTGNSSTSGTYKTGLDLSSDTSWALGYGKKNGSTVLKRTYGTGNSSFFSNPILVGPGVTITGSIWSNSTAEFNGTVSAAIYLRYYDSQLNYISQDAINSARNTNWTQTTITRTTPANTLYVVFNILTNGSAGVTYYSQPMLTFTDKVGAYVAGNYNNNASVAKAQMTADNAKRAITSYQTTNDGRISSAESNISQNAQAITTKVSQTDFNSTTGTLRTDLNTTTETANQAKRDIVTINQKDDSQDRRMYNIEQSAEGVKSTVSKLQTKQGEITGSISTLQQKAEGFEATVTKVNNMSIGGRNYVLDTGNPKTQQGSGLDNRDLFNSAIFAKPIKEWGVAGESYTISFDWKLAKALTAPMVLGVFFNQSPWQSTYNTLPAGQTSGHISYTFKLNAGILTANPDVTGLTFRVNSQLATGNSITYSRLKFEQGNMATDWSKAPEDLESATAKVKITADNAASTINSYQTTNDGRVSNAESKINQNAQAITTKVSQTDYNKKTGQIEGDISTIKQTATSISQSVTNVQNQVNTLNQVNLVNNSQMALDYSGWHLGDPWGTAVTTQFLKNGIADNSGAMYVWHNSDNSSLWIHSDPVPVNGGQVVSASITAAMPNKPASGTPLALYIRAYDANKAQVTSLGYNIPLSDLSATFTTFKLEGQTLASTARYVSFVLAWNVGGNISFGKPMLVIGNKVGDYVPGPYVNNDKVATQQITINGITNTVSEQGKDLSKITSRVQTAEGSISTAKNDISGLQSSHTQTANQLSTEINDRKNGDTNTLTQAKNFTTSSITSSEGGMRSLITQTSDAILARVEATNMVVNSEFDPLDGTWYRITRGAPAGAEVFEAWNPEQSGSFQDWPAVNGSRIINYSTGNWYTSTLQVASAGKAYSASIVAGRSPAPTVSTALDFRIAFWDSNRELIGTMSSGNIIDGTAYKGIQKYVVENKIAPANTRFVSVVIAHSSGNATDYITRPSLNIGEKASPYTPTYGTNASSTVLSLLKDNWSIGIADNISNITSGIVGNANSMSLISDRVIINAPQTQIKGTAWITSAMIADGQIGTAKIGDASITSAKISSLDVNKITGNVSNWVLSQWTSATGNKVTIDGNGMYFSPGASRMTRHGFEAWRPDSNAGGGYAAMGMLGSYAWETNSNVNGVGLFAKFNGVPHDDPGSPYRGEVWGGDTIAIGAVQPQSNHGYGYIEPYMIFPANNEVGNMYRPNNNSDTLILSRWLSIYTGLNMRGNSIVNSSGYSLKENFKPVSGKDALDVFDNTDIMTYDYKPDSEEIDERTEANRKDKVGFVINDNGQSPFKTDPRLVRYGNTRDDSVTVGYLMSAVKELHKRIKELEAQQGK